MFLICETGINYVNHRKELVGIGVDIWIINIISPLKLLL